MFQITDSDKDFLSMLGTFSVIIITSFLIVIATNTLRTDTKATAACGIEGGADC